MRHTLPQLDTRTDQDHFIADDKLLLVLLRIVYRLKRDCYICDIVLLVFSGYTYDKFDKDIPFFATTVAIAIACLGFFQYMLLSPRSKFVNETAIDIRLMPDKIRIRTASFDGPLWFRKDPLELEFPRSAEVTFKMIENPYYIFFKSHAKLLSMRYRNQEVFINANYFDKELEAELVKATM
ncbi:hypothetical protein QWY89_11890 [Mucilaginibacter myungsuensis]|uniref:hypothetical protein n=1 Tax=Mucilaginibacter myungsuensis TaxID=649104 RepID=UPI0025B30C92|nr:hypothetical protein [Mucilaginibacter myungsuensis]MDN3599348.1 hypothetical protein [Mucilaginibacter myungsuensis]